MLRPRLVDFHDLLYPLLAPTIRSNLTAAGAHQTS